MSADLASGLLTTLAELERIYPAPSGAPVVKEIDHVNAHYRAFIAASPFVVLSTCGPEGLDCSPRGDAPGFVRMSDERTLLIPDRLGNNRIDSLRNIVRDPRVSLLFLIPGVAETLRVIGRAAISADPALAETFAVNGKTPRTVMIVSVASVYFQCAKAVVRSKLWSDAARIDRSALPSTGAILAALSRGAIDGEDYDRNAPEAIRQRLY